MKYLCPICNRKWGGTYIKQSRYLVRDDRREYYHYEYVGNPTTGRSSANANWAGFGELRSCPQCADGKLACETEFATANILCIHKPSLHGGCHRWDYCKAGGGKK